MNFLFAIKIGLKNSIVNLKLNNDEFDVYVDNESAKIGSKTLRKKTFVG